MTRFPLVLISAWNDSGGGFLHRLFDGHPECFVWPFELQLGTGAETDGFADWFRAKYRWPQLAPDAPADALFDGFLDDEVKSYLRDRAASKHGAVDLRLSLAAWRRAFAARLPAPPRTAEQVIAAYVDGLFAAWTNRRASGRERVYLGHCPTLVVDADRVLADLPAARLLHVVRRPTTGFVDFRRRVPDMDVVVYCRKWTLVNALGFAFARKHPARVRLVRFADLVAARAATTRALCDWLGLAWDPALERPTWNGAPLAGMGPFGGVPVVSAEHERACEAALDPADRAVIERETAGVRALCEVD